IPDGVRNVSGPGEGRYDDKRHSHSKLVESGALLARRGLLAKLLCGIRAVVALRAIPRCERGRRIRVVRTRSWRDAVRRRCGGWSHVIVSAAVLVVDQDHNRLVPVRAISHCIDYTRDMCLARPDVVRRMLGIGKSKIHK